ncbi:MAG TPA: hypothetical protein VF940_10560 [Streptosporangiaceae bacterium]
MGATTAASSALLLAPLVPFVLKTDDHPDGVDETMFGTLRTA